jgi:two-component system, cell cycle sensor histidine kinase and response regulator CckA
MTDGSLAPALNILVVDDDADVREVIAETLVGFGYGVIQAASGEEALPMLERNHDIRVLITDVRMPGMSGFELATKARFLDASLKVIITSGYFLPQPIAERFLKKPFRMHELASAIEAELA